MILGSTRQGRSADKIAAALKKMITRTDVHIEIVDLNDYKIPFFDDAIAPLQRTEITNSHVQKWSDKIKAADAFIFVVPEYNSGYPGVLKNALDSLYKEWNNKPAALVSYSGGPSGGASAAHQLTQVLNALQMKSVATQLLIPHSWKAFDAQGNLAVENAHEKLSAMINELVQARNS